MRSLAPKARKEESEFDDLLGQLVDELAMTPGEPAASFAPEVQPPPAHVDSTQALAAEAAAAAQARAAATPASGSNNAVKIAGIIAASLSAVAIAALFVFGNQPDDAKPSDDAVAQVEPAAQVEPKVELPPAPAPTPQPVVAAPTPEPVVTPPVEPAKPEAKPKPRKRVDKKPKPKPEQPKPDPGDEFDKL